MSELGTRGAQPLTALRREIERYRRITETGEAKRNGIECSASARGLLQNLDSSVDSDGRLSHLPPPC